jgi:hypothetical protein
MRQIMFALTLVGGVAIAASAVGVTPAEARDYPYCLQGQDVGMPGDCNYMTYEQCMLSASGRLAYCNINPRFAFSHPGSGYGEPAPPPRRRHRSGY